VTTGIGDRYVMTAAINLERFRTAGVGPRFLGLGSSIRYKGRDLRDYLERCARRSTSELGPRW
jgi:hypothetical protein